MSCNPAPVASGRHRSVVILSSLAVLAVAALLLAGIVGSVVLPLADLAAALGQMLRGAPSTLAATLLELRLGRAQSAFVTGGAAVGALAAMLFMASAWAIDAAAFGGAVTVALLLYLLARRDLRGGMAAEGGASLLLLTGVILASGCGALVTLMLSIAPDSRLRGMVFWMIGDLSGTQVRWLPWLVLAAAMLFAQRVARSINVMALHAEAAATLGVRVGALRKGLFLCSAVLTASAVTSAGSIGFVGLIVPHACRFALGPDHRLLMPASTLVGGTFLVLADTLARTVLSPQQLPVGVVTAMIGVPVFLLQLHHIRRK